eukprot:gene7514-15375_t
MLPVLLGNSSFPPPGKTYKMKKSFPGDHERISWMGRTSDAIGNFMDNLPLGEESTLQECMALIRRKIQEKCHNTQELTHHIRRLKICQSKVVTPNVFRATLIKFGIILPQPLVDQVFAVFDKKRDGTILFEDFAQWVMTAEFHPDNSPIKKNAYSKYRSISDNPLRDKLREYAKEQAFFDLQSRLTFLDLVANLHRRNIDASESEIRSVFVYLEKDSQGFIYARDLMKWADLPYHDDPAKYDTLDLKAAINKVCGRQTKLIERCFSHIPKHHGIRLGYEEFKRCLLSAGLCVPSRDLMTLFMTLGGKDEHSYANMDLLFDNLIPYVPDPQLDKVDAHPAFRVGTVGNADRRLREAIRKSFKQLRIALEAADTDSSGYIEAEDMNNAISLYCMPVSFQDFRLIISQRGRVSWVHFLSIFNPRASYTTSKPCPGTRTGTGPALTSQHQHQHQHQQFLHTTDTSSSDSYRNNNSNNNNNNNIPNFEASTSFLTSAGVGSGSVTDLHDLQQVNLSRARTAPTLLNSNRSMNTTNNSSTTATATATRLNVNGVNDRVSGEIRKHWQSLQKECQRLDSFTKDILKNLADKYQTRDGTVDYSACVRSAIGDLMGYPPVILSRDRMNMTNTNTSSMVASRDSNSSSNSNGINTRTTSTNNNTTSTTSATTSNASEIQRQTLLSKYDTKVIAICKKIFTNHRHIFPQLRQLLKGNQMSTSTSIGRGAVHHDVFISILEHLDVKLSTNEHGIIGRSFRVPGMPDSVGYEEFLRLCAAAGSGSGTTTMNMT